jgi:hypothetical protein
MANNNENASVIRRELFGGAISLELPQAFIDVSTIRPLDDTQVLTLSHIIRDS